jgi:hypothetical protein
MRAGSVECQNCADAVMFINKKGSTYKSRFLLMIADRWLLYTSCTAVKIADGMTHRAVFSADVTLPLFLGIGNGGIVPLGYKYMLYVIIFKWEVG